MVVNVVNNEPCIGKLLMFPVQPEISFLLLSTAELLSDDSSSLVGTEEWMEVDGDWLLGMTVLFSIEK